MPTYILHLINSRRFGAFGVASGFLALNMLSAQDWLIAFGIWSVSEIIEKIIGSTDKIIELEKRIFELEKIIKSIKQPVEVVKPNTTL